MQSQACLPNSMSVDAQVTAAMRNKVATGLLEHVSWLLKDGAQAQGSLFPLTNEIPMQWSGDGADARR